LRVFAFQHLAQVLPTFAVAATQMPEEPQRARKSQPGFSAIEAACKAKMVTAARDLGLLDAIWKPLIEAIL